MKLNSMMLAVSLGLCAFAAGAQTMDPVPQQDSSYPRFQLYPPVDRGLEVTTRSERIRALAQFEQARVLVPHHPEVVLHLSRVYRRFEGPTRVQAVLQPAVPVGPPAFRLVFAEKRQAGWSPKADLAYGFADQAYTASAHGDHVEAVRAARQAVVLAPQKLAYRLLLVHELAEIGQLEEADAVAFRALSGPAEVGLEDDFDVEVELVKRHKQVRQRIALKHFEAANQAAAAGEGGVAIASARKGVSYAPRQLAHRLQLLSLLLATRQWSEANHSASEAMHVIGAEPALLVLRAHALQHSGQRPAASVYLEAALAAPDLSANDKQQFRLIAFDAALAAGEPEKALDLLVPLTAATVSATGEEVLQRQALALQASRRGRVLLPTAPAVWSMPKVVCAGKAPLPLCELWPGENAPDSGQAMAEVAYQAFGAGSHEAAALKAREALDLSPGNLSYRALRVNALMAGDELAQADQEASGFLATSADDAEMLALRSTVRQRLGQTSLAALDAEAALRSGNLSAASEVGLLQQLGRTKEASERCEAARLQTTLASQPQGDVTYPAIQSGQDAAPVAAFEQASSDHALAD